MSVRCIFLAFSVVVVVVCFFLPSSVAIFNYYCQKTLVFVATAHARVAIMPSFYWNKLAAFWHEVKGV